MQEILGAVPEGARVLLRAAKNRWLLGEDIRVMFRLENAGGMPFGFSYGGDYRGTGYPARFHVTVTDAQGRPLPNPNPDATNMGGLGASPTLKPGEHWEQDLPLTAYRRFDRPGVYTVRVSHDLGWKATPERPHPVATLILTVAEPTPTEARAVVATLAAKRYEGLGGKYHPNYATLGYPVYLPLLRERAERGDADAVRGIGTIPTPDPTRALLALSRSRRPQVVVEAIRTLNDRLPVSRVDHEGAFYNGTRDPRRLRLVSLAWRAEFAPAVRERGRTLLVSRDVETASEAAEMLERAGTKDDLPPLIRALDRALRRHDDRYPQHNDLTWALTKATKALLRGGAPAPLRPKTPGEAAAFLLSVEKDGAALAARAGAYLPLLRHPLPSVRTLALNVLPWPPSPLPAPLAAPVRAALPALLKDRFRTVRIAACEVAVGVRAGNFRPLLRRLLANSPDEWERGAAGRALWAQGARWDYLTTWADRMAEPGRLYEALEALSVLTPHGGGSYDSNWETPEKVRVYQVRWRAFLAEHRRAIEAGKTWDYRDVEKTLFPPEYQMGPPPAPKG